MNRRNLLAVALVLCIVAIPVLLLTAEEAKHKYIGSSKCKMCHATDAKGNQYKVWSESKHAKAYDALASEEAKKIGKEKDIADPQKADECLKCHLTEAGVDAALLADGYEKNKGVGCESCHGPGSDYKAPANMKDKAKAKENGLIEPDEKVCTKCHNDKSPNFKEFKFDEMYKKIAHANPANKK
ncbi:MAG: cytochrome c family protein [Planctomycetes bacterium]|nr:cytochrome c family protein [Planctomycetota bacterium]